MKKWDRNRVDISFGSRSRKILGIRDDKSAYSSSSAAAVAAAARLVGKCLGNVVNWNDGRVHWRLFENWIIKPRF